MKSKIFMFFFLILAMLTRAKADDKLYFHIECSPGQHCIDLAYENGTMESVLATPALVLGKDDVQSASIKTGEGAPLSLNIVISEEASKKIEKITGENVGKKLIIVFENIIVSAPRINRAISIPMLNLGRGFEQNPFWEKASWLKDLIKSSNRQSGRMIKLYVIVASSVLISALIFILLPRMKQAENPSTE